MEFRLRWILTCFALESLHIQASNGQGILNFLLLFSQNDRTRQNEIKFITISYILLVVVLLFLLLLLYQLVYKTKFMQLLDSLE